MNQRVARVFSSFWFLLPGFIFSGFWCEAAAAIHAAPAPAGETLSTRFKVSAERQELPVYVARTKTITALAQRMGTQDAEAAFVSFDMNGSVQVTVTVQGPVRGAKVLPSSSGIKPSISGNQVTFTVSTPENLTVEVNGDWENSLQVFANPMETNIPRQDDPNVLYFGPGVHTINPLKVGDGKTVYVAAGAVLYGQLGPSDTDGPIIALNGSNITLRGRGIIDGSLFQQKVNSGHIVRAHGKNIHVEGVILRDSINWTFPILQSEQVTVDNIKIFGSRPNSDGIDILNSRGVQITNSFFRTFDDLIVVKTIVKGGPESSDITVKHNVLWNEVAHALVVGDEMRSNVNNVLFSDCDVIHDKGRDWVLSVTNTDSGTASHITFDNIRIEEARRLIQVEVHKSIWTKDPELGNLQNITFRNIQSTMPEDTAQGTILNGLDAQHAVNGVLFDHVTVAGRPFQASDIRKNQFVQGVTVTP